MRQIVIRQASEDDAQLIASAVVMAIGGEESARKYCGDDYMTVLEELARMETSQYSWRNALVAEVDGALAGTVIGYDGARLLVAMRDRALAEGHEHVGLLMDFGNPDAERLYLSLGFTRMEERQFLGHDMWHLQYCRK